MGAGLARSELQTSYKAGVGKVREHTLVLGAQVIAIDNIGSIRFFENGRSWWLAFVGLLIAGGAASQVPQYGPLLWAGVGVGIMLILINMLVPVERGLSIGISDGRTATIIAKDAAFLHRLLDLLTEKINSRNETLIANFDISSNTVHVVEARGANIAAPKSISTGDSANTVAPTEPLTKPVQAVPDVDETLFASEPEPPLKPRPAPERAATASPQRTVLHDPMLDGPSIAPLRPQAERQDWLNAPGSSVYEGDQSARSGLTRWMLSVLLLAVLVGGGIAAWMAFRNPDGVASIPLLGPAATGPAESITLADAITAPPAPALIALEAAPTPAEPTPPVAGAPAATPDPTAVVDFIPPESIVARASGQRYRARPSSADDVPVLAETRSGGEALQINGHSFQSDGEWYRVVLTGGRAAWFKASLAVPQARFAETLATSSVAPASFAASSPRVLEPVEGTQLTGGSQSIRLDWIGIDSATAYRVEIQTFDSAVQRWTDEPQPRRITIQGATEVAETFGAGAWRWRVRGVSADGEQSQFSRWAAFGIRD